MSRAARLLIAAGVFLALVPITHDVVFTAGNDASRFAQIESLVDFGTPWIERSQFAWTIDRVAIGEHLYPNKPPVLSIAGAGVYRLLKLFGLSLADPLERPLVLKLLVLVLVGIPTAWLASAFARTLKAHGLGTPASRALTTAALIFATLILSFSVTLNNHTVAAALLFGGVVAAWERRALAAGLLLGLTVCVDIVPGLGFLPVAAYLLWRRPAQDPAPSARPLRPLALYVAALAACAALFVGANLATLGSPLTAKLVAGAADEGSRHAPNVAGVNLPESKLYPLECLFGGHGFLSISPVLLFGVVGLVLRLRRGQPDRGAVLAIGLGILVQVAGHILFAGLYGGWSYGFRYLIPVIPLLMLFAPATLGGWRTALFAAVALVSTGLAFLGAYHPWPPAYETSYNRIEVPALVKNPAGGNLAAWLEQEVPGWRVTEWAGRRFISPDPARRREYFEYFFGSKGDEERRRRYAR